MINFVPQASGINPDGSDAALLQALAARKKLQVGADGYGARMAQDTALTPIHHPGVGYAQMGVSALGGILDYAEGQKKQQVARQGATSAAGIAQSLGLTPQQAQQLQGMYLANPEAASAIVKQMTERLFAKPDAKYNDVTLPNGALAQRNATTNELAVRQEPNKPTFGDVGTDKFGNAQKGWIDPSKQTITPAPLSAAPQPAASPVGAPPTAGAVPPPSPDMNPVDYYKKQSDNAISGTLPADQAKVSALRQEVQGLPSYKNLAQAAPIYTAMADAASKNTKASDLNLVYGLGKIMDPGSVVREGEMVMVKNAAGLSEQLIGAVNALQGGAALTPDTRIALMREAKGRLDAYKQSFEQDAQQYHDIATRNRMNPSDVLPQFPKATEFERAGPAIPKTLQSDIAAAQQQGPPMPQQMPQGAPAAPQGLSLDVIEAEIARRQQAAAAQQDQQRYTDPMGGQY